MDFWFNPAGARQAIKKQRSSGVVVAGVEGGGEPSQHQQQKPKKEKGKDAVGEEGKSTILTPTTTTVTATPTSGSKSTSTSRGKWGKKKGKEKGGEEGEGVKGQPAILTPTVTTATATPTSGSSASMGEGSKKKGKEEAAASSSVFGWLIKRSSSSTSTNAAADKGADGGGTEGGKEVPDGAEEGVANIPIKEKKGAINSTTISSSLQPKASQLEQGEEGLIIQIPPPPLTSPKKETYPVLVVGWGPNDRRGLWATVVRAINKLAVTADSTTSTSISRSSSSTSIDKATSATTMSSMDVTSTTPSISTSSCSTSIDKASSNTTTAPTTTTTGSTTTSTTTTAPSTSTSTASPTIGLRPSETEVLKQLVQGKQWIEWVDAEYVAIYSSIYDEHRDRLSDDASRIEKDVPRTFRVFLEDSWLARWTHDLNRKERHATLGRLLNIGASISDGYCQGMNFIAGLLMLQCPFEKEVFIVLAWILRQKHLEALYSGRGYGLVLYTQIFEGMMAQHVPRLHQHFQELQFTAVMYSVEWFTTLFSISCTKLLSLALLDLFLAGVDDILLRAGLAILQMVEADLIDLEFEELHLKFKRLVQKLPAEEVLVRALGIGVPEESDSLFEAEKGAENVPEDEQILRSKNAGRRSGGVSTNAAVVEEEKGEGKGGEGGGRQQQQQQVCRQERSVLLHEEGRVEEAEGGGGRGGRGNRGEGERRRGGGGGQLQEEVWRQQGSFLLHEDRKIEEMEEIMMQVMEEVEKRGSNSSVAAAASAVDDNGREGIGGVVKGTEEEEEGEKMMRQLRQEKEQGK